MYEIYAKLRDERGLTDYQIAKEIGVSRSVFSDWKTGRHSPSRKNRYKIFQALGLPPTQDCLFKKLDYTIETNGMKIDVEHISPVKPKPLFARTLEYFVQLADGSTCKMSAQDYEQLQNDIDIYIESWLKSKKLI